MYNAQIQQLGAVPNYLPSAYLNPLIQYPNRYVDELNFLYQPINHFQLVTLPNESWNRTIGTSQSTSTLKENEIIHTSIVNRSAINLSDIITATIDLHPNYPNQSLPTAKELEPLQIKTKCCSPRSFDLYVTHLQQSNLPEASFAHTSAKESNLKFSQLNQLNSFEQIDQLPEAEAEEESASIMERRATYRLLQFGESCLNEKKANSVTVISQSQPTSSTESEISENTDKNNKKRCRGLNEQYIHPAGDRKFKNSSKIEVSFNSEKQQINSIFQEVFDEIQEISTFHSTSRTNETFPYLQIQQQINTTIEQKRIETPKIFTAQFNDNQQNRSQNVSNQINDVMNDFWSKKQDLVYSYINNQFTQNSPCLQKSSRSKFQRVLAQFSMCLFQFPRKYCKTNKLKGRNSGALKNTASPQLYFDPEITDQASRNYRISTSVEPFQEFNILQTIPSDEIKITTVTPNSVETIQYQSALQINQLKNTCFSEITNRLSLDSSLSLKQANTNLEIESPDSLNIADEQPQNQRKDRMLSRFQNLTKLLMQKIIRIFKKENLTTISLDERILLQVEKIINKLTHLMKDKKIKSDFINHSHYRVIFLKLTNDSIYDILRKPDREKDIKNHENLFSLDLENPKALDLSYCNIMKLIIFKIFELFCKLPEQIDKIEKPDINRLEYLQFASEGIAKMNQGQVIHSFYTNPSKNSSTI